MSKRDRILNDKLPLTAWALLDGDGLAVTSGQLPLFWLKRTAKSYNRGWLQGAGRVVAVTISQKSKAKVGESPRDF